LLFLGSSPAFFQAPQLFCQLPGAGESLLRIARETVFQIFL
jgi:hypothetical protein